MAPVRIDTPGHTRPAGPAPETVRRRTAAVHVGLITFLVVTVALHSLGLHPGTWGQVGLLASLLAMASAAARRGAPTCGSDPA